MRIWLVFDSNIEPESFLLLLWLTQGRFRLVWGSMCWWIFLHWESSWVFLYRVGTWVLNREVHRSAFRVRMN